MASNMENTPYTPPVPTTTPQPGVPSPAAQSWGVVISIVVIVSMIIIGAFYTWGKRVAEQKQLSAPSGNTQQY